MTQTVTGVLKKISAKSGVSKNGPWTAYSLGLSINGSDDYNWFRFGFKNPGVTEGSVVSFDVAEDPAGTAATGKPVFKVVGEINVDKNATSVAVVPDGATKKSWGGKSDGVQDQIVRQNALGAAIAAADSMLANGVVKLPAGAADKYEFYMELLDKLTYEFFVANRTAKSVEDLASENLDEAEEAIDEGGPTEDDAWSPV
jgi:hypothetical protein